MQQTEECLTTADQLSRTCWLWEDEKEECSVSVLHSSLTASCYFFSPGDKPHFSMFTVEGTTVVNSDIPGIADPSGWSSFLSCLPHFLLHKDAVRTTADVWMIESTSRLIHSVKFYTNWGRQFVSETHSFFFFFSKFNAEKKEKKETTDSCL